MQLTGPLATKIGYRMNLKHGFDSKNVHINPDCILISNIEVKSAISRYMDDIKQVVEGKIVRPGITDLVVYLIDCALPNAPELFDEKIRSLVWEYYETGVFKILSRSNSNKQLQKLIDSAEWFKNN